MIRNFARKTAYLWSIIKIFKKSAILLFILILLTSITEALGLSTIMPLLGVILDPSASSSKPVPFFGPLLNSVSMEHQLLFVGVLMVGLILLKNIFFILKTGYGTYFVYRFKKLWQCSVMEKYMHAQYAFIISQKQGTLLNNVILEPGRAAKSLQQMLEYLAKIVMAISLITLLMIINWQFTLLVFVVFGMVFLTVSRLSGVYSLNVGKKKISLAQEIMSIASENIGAVRQVKIFSLENSVCRFFLEKVSELIRIMVKFTIIRNLPNPVLECMFVSIIMASLVYMHYFSSAEISTFLPVIGVFIVTSQRLLPVVAGLFAERMNIITFIPSLKLVNELHNMKVNKESIYEGEEIKSLKGDICFQCVNFAHDSRENIFHNLTFKIKKGKMTALVGPSGSGKSTLVDLLVGLYSYQGGEIIINGISQKKIALHSWRKLIGYVSQDTFLFNTSVAENIRVGCQSVSDLDVQEAARAACAHEFICELPEGYNTLLGERGMKLSGGQRQRIAIARALVRNPELLIFDEATSALDTQTELLIQETIERLSKDRTVVIIAHRLSTVKNADILYSLKNGTVTLEKSYDDLLKNGVA